MDALRSAFGKQKKRKLSKGGSATSSRRSNTPPPPDFGEASTRAGDLPSANQRELIPYPFSAQLRLDACMKARETKLRKFVVITPIFPDIEYLKDPLLIYDELAHIFVSCGFGFVFGENPGVFEKVVREFMYSFLPRWDVAEIGKDKVRFVKEWSFRLGGRDFRLGSDDLRSAFGLESQVPCLPPTKTMKNELWRMITKSDGDYKSGCKTTQIKMPLWKFIHRLIATCIYLRKDGGRFVTSEDLELMVCFYAKLEVDPLCCITKALEEPISTAYRGHYIGGGHFVSFIARFVGFSLNPSKALPSVILGENELISRGLIKRVNISGCWEVFLADSDELENATRSGRRSSRPSPHPERGEPSTTHHQSSDYDEVLRRLDSLSTSARGFAAWQNDMTEWQSSMTSWHGNMMRGLYTNLGFSGYTSPPRHSFHHGFTRNAPPMASSPPRHSYHHAFTRDVSPMDTTHEGFAPTFTRENENWDEGNDEDDHEDAEADEGTDDSSDDGDDHENREVTASDQHESPDHYQLVYRRRNH